MSQRLAALAMSVVLLAMALVACRSGHARTPAPTTPTPTPSPIATETPHPPPTPFPVPTAIHDASGALRAAFEALYGSNPPYSTGDVQTGRYAYTTSGIADRIAGTGDFGDVPGGTRAWLFVFTGRFGTSNRFTGETHSFHSAFVVVDSVPGFLPAVMSPAGSSYDLTPAGPIHDVPKAQIEALVAERQCEKRHLGINPTECPTPVISLSS